MIFSRRQNLGACTPFVPLSFLLKVTCCEENLISVENSRDIGLLFTITINYYGENVGVSFVEYFSL